MMPFNQRAAPAHVLALTLLCAAVAPVTAAAATTAPVLSRGQYTDAAGGRHPWSISGAHTLIWDDKPFLPVGGRFEAQSWTASPAPADWDADARALATLKTKGVTDLYVQPARGGGITGVKPLAIQKLLDHLDKEGFTYGLSLSDGPREPLIGYLVRPGAFRQAGVAGGSLLRFSLENITSSLYFVVGATNSEIVEAGEATLVENGVRVSVAPRAGEFVTFLVPEKIYFPGNTLGLPNLWEGFDGYRDNLLELFAQVKLGPGFRFFVDALPADLALKEEGDRFVPTSRAFQTEWGAWLARRYKSADVLQNAWAMPDRELLEIKQAAPLIPLWSGGKGVSAFHDPQTGKRFRVDAFRRPASAFWSDLQAFKAESVRGYMHDLATVLKRNVADVPVVYRWTGYGPLFASPPALAGFDGIGIEAYGSGPDLVTRAGGLVYAQASEAPKTLWLPVTGTQSARAAAAKTDPGYPSASALFADLDWLREIGARGFYVDSLRVLDPARRNFSLIETPGQLDWLKQYAAMLSTTATGLDRPPATIFYPRGSGHSPIGPRALPGGEWWLPTDRQASVFDFGAFGRAYGLADNSGSVVYYLWNPRGPRTIRLRLPKPAPNVSLPLPPVQVLGAPDGREKNGVLTLTVGPDPISIRNLRALPVPLDAFAETAKEAEALVKVAQEKRLVEASKYRSDLNFLLAHYKEDNAFLSLSAVQALTAALRQVLRPYVWVEAESASEQSFDENTERAGASGGRVLSVGERAAAGGAASRVAATATYTINVGEAGEYTLWASATPRSQLTFRFDGQPVDDPGRAPSSVGAAYAGGLVWTRHAAFSVPKGQHTIELRADGPAIVDTLLLTRAEFTPDASNPPPVLAR